MRVVVAEDVFLLRAGVADELLSEVRDRRPDVVVTDIRMPPTQTDEGLRAAAAIRSELPRTPVVVLSQHVDEAYALRLLGDGAEGLGYLLEQRVTEPGTFADAVRQVARGGSALDPEVVARPHTLERHLTSVFDKLGLPPSAESHRRVLAVLTYLHAQGA